MEAALGGGGGRGTSESDFPLLSGDFIAVGGALSRGGHRVRERRDHRLCRRTASTSILTAKQTLRLIDTLARERRRPEVFANFDIAY